MENMVFHTGPAMDMLSYSSAHSGSGVDVDRIGEATLIATELAQKSYPGLLIEGPIPYNTAVDTSVDA
jgi:phosphate acetyltransferase